MNLELMKCGYPPIVLPVEKRLEYYEALDTAHTKNEFTPFLSLITAMGENAFRPYWHVLGITP